MDATRTLGCHKELPQGPSRQERMSQYPSETALDRIRTGFRQCIAPVAAVTQLRVAIDQSAAQGGEQAYGLFASAGVVKFATHQLPPADYTKDNKFGVLYEQLQAVHDSLDGTDGSLARQVRLAAVAYQLKGIEAKGRWDKSASAHELWASEEETHRDNVWALLDDLIEVRLPHTPTFCTCPITLHARCLSCAGVPKACALLQQSRPSPESRTNSG